MKKNQEILEILATVEHERWAKWQKYVHSICVANKDGSLTISKSQVDHWEKEIATPYSELTEKLKEYDRTEAKKTIIAVCEYFEKIFTLRNEIKIQ